MTKTTLLLMLLLGVIAAALVVLAAQVYVPNPPTPVDLKNAEIALKDADLRLAEAHARLIQTKVQAKSELLRMQNQSKIDNDPAIVQARIAAKRFWILWPFVTFYAAGCGAAAFVVYHAIRRVEFQAAGVATYVTRRQAAVLAEKALYLQGVTEQAKIAALTEQIGRERFAQGVSLFASLGRAWKSGVTAVQAALPEAVESPQTAGVVSFAEMVNAGKFTHGKPLLFGFGADGAAKTGSWQDCYSLGIAGLSGYGKSSAIRFLMSESLLTGAVSRFYIVDPHYPHPDSLLASLGALRDAAQVDYADGVKDISRVLKAVNAEIDARLAGRQPSEPVSVVIIDELLAAVKIDGVSDLIERIGTESRKAGVYGVFASQSWLAEKTGGTTARDSLTAILSFRMKRKQAQTFLQDKDLAAQVTRLNKGQALFAPVAGEPEILTIPFASREDMQGVVSRLKTHDDAPRREIDVDVRHDTAAQTSPHDAADVIDFAAEKARRAVNVDDPVDAAETPVATSVDAVDGADENAVDLLKSVRRVMQVNSLSLGEVARRSGVDKGLLSKLLNGKKALTPAMQQALTVFLMTEKSEANA